MGPIARQRIAEYKLEDAGAVVCPVAGTAEILALLSARTRDNENVRPESFTTAPWIY
jgi:hypothetical protein